MPKALIIDDEEDIIDLLTYHLERKGFQVLSIDDQEAAIRLCNVEKPELIIIHHLPNYADKNAFCKKLIDAPGVQGSCFICLETTISPDEHFSHKLDACINIPLLPEKLIEEIQFHYNNKHRINPMGER